APQAQSETGDPVEVRGESWPTLVLKVRKPEAFVTWVLSLLDAAVVVTEGDLRDEVVARLDAIAGMS
ncbi:MAG: WYL domain-containing protein, partial [Acidimicrobiia bacterium]|nr:WYL domain-containing protein [Acidimicrobiia bacterium]